MLYKKDTDILVSKNSIANKYYHYKSIIDLINEKYKAYKLVPFDDNPYSDLEDLNNRIINLCKENDVKYALLKEKSPTCGSHFIYNGTFSRKLIQGSGLLVSELKKLHIQIFNEDEVLKLLNIEN